MEKIKSFGGYVGGTLEKLGAAWDWLTGNDTEKKKRAEAQALYDQKKQEQEALIAKMPKSMQAQARADWEAANRQEKSVWGAQVPTAGAAAVPTIAQAQDAKKAAEVPVQKPAKSQAASSSAAPARGASKSASAPQKPDTQIVQPQVQVAVNVTQNGIP